MARNILFPLALALLGSSMMVCGQFYRGAGEYLFIGVPSDYMYRFRVAVTPVSNLVYGINDYSQLAQYTFDKDGRGIFPPTRTSGMIPMLNDTQPVINVDTTTDRAYFVHPTNGKIYCYEPSPTDNSSLSIAWITPFVCSLQTGDNDQHRQAFSANGKRLLARCNDSVVLLSSKGALLQNYSSNPIQAFVRSSDLAAPIPTYAKFTRMITWYWEEDYMGTAQGYLNVWDLTSSSKKPTKPKATVALPEGVVPAGVNTDQESLVVVVDANAPVVYVYSTSNGLKLRSSYDFRAATDPEGALELKVVPTPSIANGTMYGIIEGRDVSLYPWLYPDSYSFWVFALNCTVPTAPSLRWITPRTNTSGPLQNQTLWVTDPAVFMTELYQNSTRSYNRKTGATWFNAPADPLSTARTAYSLIKGTYKISLPWVTRDGYGEVIQYDNGDYQPGVNTYTGFIRIFRGLPPSPPPPPSPPYPSTSP